MQDAVFNIGRMALLVDALHTGDLAQLALAMEDRLHQPYRMPLITGMEELIPQAKALGRAERNHQRGRAYCFAG